MTRSKGRWHASSFRSAMSSCSSAGAVRAITCRESRRNPMAPSGQQDEPTRNAYGTQQNACFVIFHHAPDCLQKGNNSTQFIASNAYRTKKRRRQRNKTDTISLRAMAMVFLFDTPSSIASFVPRLTAALASAKVFTHLPTEPAPTAPRKTMVRTKHEGRPRTPSGRSQHHPRCLLSFCLTLGYTNNTFADSVSDVAYPKIQDAFRAANSGVLGQRTRARASEIALKCPMGWRTCMFNQWHQCRICPNGP